MEFFNKQISNLDGAPFGGGFIMGIWSSISIWKVELAKITGSTVMFEVLGKLGMTVLLGFAGGFAGILASQFGKDIYKFLKNKFNKHHK